MNISQSHNFSELPRGMAKKLASMVKSGRTTPQAAAKATEDLAPFAGLAADIRRSGASQERLDELSQDVADIFKGIESKDSAGSPQAFNEKGATQTLMASYGESVVKNESGTIHVDERAAVRTYYGKKNGVKASSDIASRPTARAAGGLDSKQQAALKDFKNFIEERWARIDTSGDGQLQFDEIHRLAKDRRYSGERLDYIALLLGNFGQFAADSNKVGKERVSVEKSTFEALSDSMSPIAQRTGRSGLLRPEPTVESYAATRTDLDSVYGKGIDPLNLQQGSIGDCWYISYLSACSPEELEQVVKPHPEKNAAVVHLQGDRERVIDAPSKVELFWSAKSDGYWGFALEEALNQRGRDSEPVLPGEHVLYDGLQTEAHSYINGGSVRGLLTADNQKDSYWDNFHWTDRKRTDNVNECREFVADSLAKGQKLFSGSEGASDTMTLENKVVGYHAYQVLSYDAETDTVRVRNPWGGQDPRDLLKSSPSYDGKNDGIYTVEMAEFVATFDCVYTMEDKKS